MTWSHLVRRHDWKGAHPLKEYAGRFGVKDPASPETRRKGRRSLIAHFEKKGRRWTRRRVTKEIRTLARKGLALHSTAASRYGSLTTEARMLFGTWGKAVKAAGFDYGEIRRGRAWTRARVCRALRKDKRDGKDLSGASARRRDRGLYDAAVERFGTWYRALEAAGISSHEARLTRVLTREFILERIRAQAARGRPVSSTAMKDDGGIVVAAWRLFGGWRRAVEAAGCAKHLQEPRHWTRKELRGLFRRIYAQHGYVSSGLLAKHRTEGRVGPEYSAKTYFRSLSRAKRAFGMPEDGRLLRNRKSPAK